MKTSTILAGIILTIAALIGTIWVGKFGEAVSETGPIPAQEIDQSHAGHDHPEGDKFAPSEGSAGERPVISESGPHPVAVVEELTFKFGTMQMGTEKSHAFVIRNDGKVPLILGRGPTTCQCTISSLKQNTIAPGETASIELVWKPNGPTEHFLKGATIWSNDPKMAEFDLRIDGKVVESFEVFPKNVWSVGQITNKKTTVYTGRVVSRSLDQFEITNIQCENESVQIEKIKIDPKTSTIPDVKSGYSIKLTFPPTMKVGSFSHILKIETDIVGGTETEIDLVGYTSGPFQILPTFGVRWSNENKVVSMGQVDSSKGKKVTLSVFVDKGVEDFKFLDVKTAPKFLKVDVKKDENFQSKDRERYELTIEVPAGSPALSRVRDNLATIDIRTNNSDIETVTISVSFICL